MAKETKDLKSVFALRKAKEEKKTNKVEVTIESKLLPFITRFGQEKIDGWKQQNSG